ncbi:MAG: beta-lactamase family protein [Sphingomonas sp.]|uniref:serine hydrolase domain-containing protein n=1 Tax=Sphingomonas sp. TaxID=28214 RepID=UPI001AC6A906|nr:serine hydrolase domain-containing protein [Sphingomonas sp.]MBN8816173.1 beta-lactamase family protein [Sphingomonas sp.]
MRKFLTSIVTGTALAAILAGGALAQAVAPAPQPVPVVPAADPLPGTRALLDGYVTSGKMPGIVAAFGVGDKATIFLAAGKVGTGAGAAAAGPDSLWRVYSMTKPITAMAAMILIEDGKLKLDQPVSDILPAFKNMRVMDDANGSVDATHPAKAQITIRHLLTHTAGLGYDLGQPVTVKGSLLDRYRTLGINPAQVSRATELSFRTIRPATLQAFATKVAAQPLLTEPGAKWSYSIGLDVLAAVVEKAADMPFDKFVQTRLFDPLKMKSSYWRVPASEAGRFATNYAFLPGGDKTIPLDPAATSVYLDAPSFPYGGAGLVMSASDYDRFLHMLQNYGELDGVRVMKAETAKLAMSDLLPPGVIFGALPGGTGGTMNLRMGFGAGGSVILEDHEGSVGAGTYGWGGAAGTIAYVNPIKKLRGTVMVNYFPGEKWPVRAETTKAFLSDIAGYK